LTLGKDDRETGIEALSILRCEAPTELISCFHEPSICLIAQVLEASEGKPYLSLKLNLDQRDIAQMRVGSNLPMPQQKQADRGMTVSWFSCPCSTLYFRFLTAMSPSQFGREYRRQFRALTLKNIKGLHQMGAPEGPTPSGFF
jgi:hypothetical protein